MHRLTHRPSLALALLKRMASTIPVVFVGVGDPIGDGFVSSLAHPGGNITGFAGFDGPIGQIAPRLCRTAHHFFALHQRLVRPDWRTLPLEQAMHSIQQAGIAVTQLFAASLLGRTPLPLHTKERKW
jgi:hypothetical protein